MYRFINDAEEREGKQKREPSLLISSLALHSC